MQLAARLKQMVPVVLLCLFGFISFGYGHALQPGYLELRLIEADRYAVLWKVPTVRGRPMSISAQLPKNCKPRQPTTANWDGAAYISRWTANCPGGPEGGKINIAGLEQTKTDVLVRFELVDGAEQTRRLTASDPSFQVPSAPGRFDVVETYLLLGVEHILSGIDHLLFVLALMLLVTGTRRIIVTVTAFTLAHSLTLAASTLGILYVAGPPVEAVIALSIMFVASEIIRSQVESPGITHRYPWIVAFIFGLLHGFGFAGALVEIGLPQQSIILALLFFNIGVEIGQLLFVAAVVAAFWVSRVVNLRAKWLQISWINKTPPYAIGSIAAFWVIQRIIAF